MNMRKISEKKKKSSDRWNVLVNEINNIAFI